MTMKTTTKKQAIAQNENVIDFGMLQPFNICANIMNKVNDIMQEKDLTEVEIHFRDDLLRALMNTAEDKTKFLIYVSNMLLTYALDYDNNLDIRSVVLWYNEEMWKFGLKANLYI